MICAEFLNFVTLRLDGFLFIRDHVETSLLYLHLIQGLNKKANRVDRFSSFRLDSNSLTVVYVQITLLWCNFTLEITLGSKIIGYTVFSAIINCQT